MAKFNYKFKNIKEIKQRFEKKSQKELAVIDVDINIKKNEIYELYLQLKEHKKKKTASKTKTINELHFYEKYESFLLEQIDIIQKYVSERLKERKEKMNELVEKSKETKTFEKLEERHLTEFLLSHDKSEQKDLDEFAVNEYLKE